MADTRWLEISVRAEAEAVESLSELFAQYGYNGGVVIEEPIRPDGEGGYLLDSAALVVVRTYMPVLDEAAAPPDEQDVPDDSRTLTSTERIEKLRTGAWYLGRLRRVESVEVVEKAEADWANAWKEHYQAHRIGNRTVIKPPWQEFTPNGDEVVVEIDPGMAFGTGLHPTTRLCLLMIEERVPALLKAQPTPHLLDLGTGSGILAIAAAKIIRAEVLHHVDTPFPQGIVQVAVDSDPVAVAAARENIARNGLADEVLVAAGSLAVEPPRAEGESGGFYSFAADAQTRPQSVADALPFDLILANLISRIFVGIAPDLAAALKPGGELIASGILAERADEVKEALAAAGLSVVRQEREGDWVALLARKEG